MIEKLMIAKSGDNSYKWLPLCVHLEDTAGIMNKLIEEFVSDSFSETCGLSKEDLKKTAIFLACVHDIGKATIVFQYKIGQKIPERLEVLKHYKIEIPIIMPYDKMQVTPHAIAGEAILRYMGCPESIAAVAGAHHGEPTESYNIINNDLNGKNKDIVGYENYFGQNERTEIETIWNNIIKNALEYSGVNTLEELPVIDVQAQMIICGLLITADWLASNINFFPLISIDKTSDDVCCYQRVENAWFEIGFSEMWKSVRKIYSDYDFKNTFGFLPRLIQREFLDIVEKSSKPGIYILEAPMGCGKTEAALSVAEIVATKSGKNGLFFGLPTQATANGIFPRIIDWAEKQSKEFYRSVNLKHGNATLNEVFTNIQRGIPEEESDSGLIVHTWFCDNKKACLADFVVATVDQMLMMALKRRHVMLLHLGLSEKVVIIDEVHAYDAYMNQYLERALQWLGKYNTPVILLSATLPASRRISLIHAYLGVKHSHSKFEESVEYPLLTWTDKEEIYQKSLSYNGVHKNINVRKCHNDDIYDVIKDVVESGGCVGIILNTVRRAQKISDVIRNEITKDVLLYHSQYIMTDRVKKENYILEKVGKGSTAEMRKGFVVVGTQVLEQSLDIDFDLLITDICPMDLLLQRMGRLHRHDRDYRPEILKKAVCYIITDEFENEKSGSRSIYGDWLLKETLEYLPENIILPDDISPLVQKVYSVADDSDECKKYFMDIKNLQSKASIFLLDKSDDTIDDTIHNLLDRTVKDNNAEASVRDGISSIEVIVMQIKKDDLICFIDGTPLSSELSEDECQRIAGQRLRLPSRFSYNWIVDNTIKEIEEGCMKYIKNWQKSYLLVGQLVLFFDENYEAKLMGYKLKYSYEYGLICEKDGDKNE